MTQAVSINNPVLLQPPDPLRFLQVRQAPDIPVEAGEKTCFSNLQEALIVRAPTNVTMEGWRCEGSFARAVVVLIHDSIYPVIESMWQNSTGGVWKAWIDSRYPLENPQAALVDSGHGEMFISSSALHHISDPMPLGSTYSRALINIGPTKVRGDSLARLPAPDSDDTLWLHSLRRIPEDETDRTYNNHQSVVDQHQTAEHAQAALRVERLTEIQTNLGLSMQMLAEVLRISRPQLYKWFDAENSISLQKNSVLRLDEVEQLARKWRALSAAPLKSWVRERIDGGRSLFDLLTAEPLQTVEIEQAFSQIAARIAQAPKSRSARLREAGFTRRASHRSLPSDD